MTEEHPKNREKASKGMLDWAESHGLDNLREHIVDLGELKKDAAQMVSIIIVGLGATIGYVAHQLDQGALQRTGWAVAALSLYLVASASYLIIFALMIKEKPLASDEPLGLVDGNFSIEQMKLAEIGKIQLRIEAIAKRNASTARHINVARWLAIASPLVFVLALAISPASGEKESAAGSLDEVRVVGPVRVQASVRGPEPAHNAVVSPRPSRASGPESRGHEVVPGAQVPAPGPETGPETKPVVPAPELRKGG